MSSVGFNPFQQRELETLREAYKTLNDVMKNIARAEACLSNRELKLTADHLYVAKWNCDRAKKAIAVVGQSKSQEAGS